MPRISTQSSAFGASCTIGSHTIGTMQRSTSSPRRFSISSARSYQKNGPNSATPSQTTSASYRSRNTGQSEPKTSGQFRSCCIITKCCAVHNFFIIQNNYLIYRLIFVQISDTPEKQQKSVRFWILPSKLSTEIVDVLILAAGVISV